MSVPMIRITAAMEVSGHDAGEAFAVSDEAIQRQFLIAWAEAAAEFSWPMQCSFIANEDPAAGGLSAKQRSDISMTLQILIDHLHPKESNT